MKTVQVEYHQVTGEIVCVRLCDAAVIPPQPVQPGHAELVIDQERDPALAEQVRREAPQLRVHPVTGQLERKVNHGTV